MRLSHNRAGANLASGVASALLERDHADAGLFEVDEAALPHVASELQPTVVVLGNLFRDQLDRYGELEAIAERWSTLTASLPGDRVLVRNADDPLVASLNPGSARVIGFGIDDPAAGLAGMEHASDSKWCANCGHRLRYATVYLGHLGDWSCPNCDSRRPRLDVYATAVEIDGLEGCRFELVTPFGRAAVRLPVPGLYNVYNAVAAAAAACATGVVGLDRMVSSLDRFDPAFGRFEQLRLGERDAVLVLIKNPAGANEVVRTLDARSATETAADRAERPDRGRPRCLVDLGRRFRAVRRPPRARVYHRHASGRDGAAPQIRRAASRPGHGRERSRKCDRGRYRGR